MRRFFASHGIDAATIRACDQTPRSSAASSPLPEQLLRLRHD